ncbi:MAG: hypothetical protein ACRDAQ_05645 [Cetobacterium sp.]
MKLVILFLIMVNLTFSKFENIYNVSTEEKTVSVNQTIGTVTFKTFNFFNDKNKSDQIGIVRVVKYETNKKAMLDFERIIEKENLTEIMVHTNNKFIGLKDDEYFLVLKNYGDLTIIQYITGENSWDNMKKYLLANDIESEKEIKFTELYIN